jgi:hypothetical protein
VHRIDSLYLGGRSVNRIAATLNEEGVPSRNGGRWAARVILDLLDHPAHAGYVRHAGEVYENGNHEPIRTPETWAAIKARRKALRESGGGRGRNPRRHLLTKGLLRCGRCGRAMTARTYPRTGDYYVCSRRHTYHDCDMPTVPRERIDGDMLAHFESLMLDARGTLAGINAEAERSIAEAQALAEGSEREAAKAEERLARVGAT